MKKTKGPNKDASVPLKRRNKIILGDREREKPGWERGEEEERGTGSGKRGDRNGVQSARTIMEICGCPAWGLGGWQVAGGQMTGTYGKSQRPGM